MPLSSEQLAALRAAVGPDALHLRASSPLGEAGFLDFGRDRTREFVPEFDVLVFARTTEEVAAVVQVCRNFGLGLVPSGGRTGLAGGAVARAGEVVLSFARMNRVLHFDPHLPALRLEAGVITRTAQELAATHGYFFPLDLAASGSSQVGGNLATNAGGTRLIRVGSLRDAVTGMVVVTGAGEILRFPGTILKNNTGIDLKQLFIGSEGCLGLITEATIRLARRPGELRVLVCALNTLADALEVLPELRGAGLEPYAFEVFDAASLRAVRAHLELAPPLTGESPWYLLVEWDAAEISEDRVLELFVGLEGGGRVTRTRLAESGAGAAHLWRYREGISESLSRMPDRVWKYDVSVPLGRMVAWLTELEARLAAAWPGVHAVVFGHAGDGNLHVNLVAPRNTDGAPPEGDSLDRLVYELVQAYEGSISAEHGIGLSRVRALRYSRAPEEIRLMRALKQVFDPDGILNPGKMLPPREN